MPAFYNYIERERAVADWIAGMTDRFAIRLFKEREQFRFKIIFKNGSGVKGCQS
jgi:hypothetical protein